MSRGFVLIELVVTMVIIGILALLISVGLPKWRASQAIVQTEEQLSSLFRDASQKALQEARTPECVTKAQNLGGSPDQIRRCSDVGLHLSGNTVSLFADISGDGRYQPTGDYLLSEQNIPPGVQFTTGNTDFVFRAAPPTIQLFVDTGGAVGQIMVQSGDQQAVFKVDSYGVLTQS